MSKPETSFRLGLEKYLPPKSELHREKMANPYSSGTADSWYSGPAGDLWVEYKFEKLPVRAATLVPITLSELQKLWLAGRFKEGRNVAVIVGCKDGGVVFRNLTWLAPLNKDMFVSRLLSRKELAKWIADQTMGTQ